MIYRMKAAKGHHIQTRLQKVEMVAGSEQEQLMLVRLMAKLGAYPLERLAKEAEKNGELCTIAEY